MAEPWLHSHALNKAARGEGELGGSRAWPPDMAEPWLHSHALNPMVMMHVECAMKSLVLLQCYMQVLRCMDLGG